MKKLRAQGIQRMFDAIIFCLPHLLSKTANIER
jgi:hypothetical protein